MVAVCGMLASSIASSASAVPAIEVRTPPISDSGGMLLKSAGSSSGRTKVQGPASVFDRYQRPERRRYMFPVATSRSHGVSVFCTYRILPSARLCQLGAPSEQINSEGSVAVTISGGVFQGFVASSGLGSICTRSEGGDEVCTQGPMGSLDS